MESKHFTGMKSGEYKLPRCFSLKQKALVASLFDRNIGTNQTVAYGSVRILFRFIPLTENALPFLVAFTSGKHKKAVTRNQIKRYLRANFQLHQQILPTQTDMQLICMIIYRGKAEEAQTKIPLDLPTALQKLSK